MKLKGCFSAHGQRVSEGIILRACLCAFSCHFHSDGTVGGPVVELADVYGDFDFILKSRRTVIMPKVTALYCFFNGVI